MVSPLAGRCTERCARGSRPAGDGHLAVRAERSPLLLSILRVLLTVEHSKLLGLDGKPGCGLVLASSCPLLLLPRRSALVTVDANWSRWMHQAAAGVLGLAS